MTDTLSWPCIGSFVYDLSVNGFTGILYELLGSGSAGALNFLDNNARLEITSSAFTSSLSFQQQLYVGVRYETGSFGKMTTLASTWGYLDYGTLPSMGYAYFLSINATEQLDNGIQTYSNPVVNGSARGASGVSVTSAAITGSAANYSMMANITSGSYKTYINNSLVQTVTIPNTDRWFSYGSYIYISSPYNGRGMMFGNRAQGEHFNGNFYKAIVYKRALSDSELLKIEEWFNL
jgi:hypothetical protein